MVEPLQKPAKKDLLTINVLDGIYTCTEILGKGGQAKCWYASDPQHRDFAIKVFKNHPAGNAFDEEVRIYETLGEHANLVRYVDSRQNGLQVFTKLNPIYQRNCAYIVLQDIPGGAYFDYVARV